MTNFINQVVDVIKAVPNNLTYSWSMFFDKIVDDFFSDDNKYLSYLVIALIASLIVVISAYPIATIICGPIVGLFVVFVVAYCYSHHPRNRDELISIQFHVFFKDQSSTNITVSYPRSFWYRHRNNSWLKYRLFDDNSRISHVRFVKVVY